MSRAQEAAITFKANKLSSVKTQLPYGYYTLPYCRPERIISSAENLGEVLRGDRIVNSLYQVRERPLSVPECCSVQLTSTYSLPGRPL